MAELTNYNAAICAGVAGGGLNYGYGVGSFPASIGQPGFHSYYNLNPSSLCKSRWREDTLPFPQHVELTSWNLDTADILGAYNALFFGGAVGAISQCFVAVWI